VSSNGRRHRIEWLSRRPDGAAQVPPVFVLGVVMMAAVVGGLMLRSVVAGSSATPAGGVGASEAVPAGSRLTGDVASPSASPPVSTSTSGAGSSAAVLPAVASSAASSTANLASLTGYVWPLDKAMITLPFGPTSWGEFIVNGQLFHDGVDMATFCGDYVRAAHAGTVLAASRQYDEFIGWVGSLTPYHNLLDTKHWWNSLPIVVVIDDGDGYRSIYAHESKVIVAPGQKVVAGQVIGYEGATGNATGCHVHFGLFSPTETATFAMDPTIVKKDLVPAAEIARIDPLLVLPFRCEIEEMRALRPAEAVGCPPLPTPTPAARATKTPASTEQPSASAVPSGPATGL
jgi:murein DD-endopeptidase MepM/ murein hydrolase activator NlpD